MSGSIAKRRQEAKKVPNARVIGLGRGRRKDGDEVVIALGRGRHPISAMTVVAQGIWPTKTALSLGEYAGVDPRRAADWLLGKSKPSAEAMQTMLQGDHGFEFLTAWMSTERPAWWRKFKRQMDIAQNRSALDEARRRLEALERGEE